MDIINDPKDKENVGTFYEIKKSLGGVNVELYLSNYAAKSDLKNVTEDDASKIAKKVDLASLKFNVDKLDIDKLKNVLI